MKVHTRVKRGLGKSTNLNGSKRKKLNFSGARQRKKFKTEESMLNWLERNNALEYDVVELGNESKYNFKAFINKQKLI